ncbi:hypothetical protein [Anatilimnocola floriformis]|uniref:hypothetical protein n=1 Tax=Anatilimnocola floriformis TaxID=2948575 RepID=UPI0020C4199C|nr:hypothetical protein [Anatilimnocola floriformis]
MNARIFALLVLLFASTANAELVTDRAYGVKHNPAELRLTYRPQDGDKQYVTVFGTGARLTEAKGWFETNPELKRLKESSHFNCIDTTSVMFRDRYASNTPATTLIRIQDQRGKTIHEFSNLPMSAEAFIRKMNHECPRREQDDPPQPLPPPNTPAPAPKPSMPLWPIALILATIAATVGGILGIKAKWTETHF